MIFSGTTVAFFLCICVLIYYNSFDLIALQWSRNTAADPAAALQLTVFYKIFKPQRSRTADLYTLKLCRCFRTTAWLLPDRNWTTTEPQRLIHHQWPGFCSSVTGFLWKSEDYLLWRKKIGRHSKSVKTEDFKIASIWRLKIWRLSQLS